MGWLAEYAVLRCVLNVEVVVWDREVPGILRSEDETWKPKNPRLWNMIKILEAKEVVHDHNPRYLEICVFANCSCTIWVISNKYKDEPKENATGDEQLGLPS